MNSLTNLEVIFNNLYEKNKKIFFEIETEKEENVSGIDIFKITSELQKAMLQFLIALIMCYIQMIDDMIFRSPVVQENFTSKGFSQTHIMLDIGEIPFKRRRYNIKKDKSEFIEHALSEEELDEDLLKKLKGEGSKDIYILDYVLSINNTLIDGVSNDLLTKILKSCTEMSYRKASANIERFSSISISHTKLWSILQKFSDKIRDYQRNKSELNKANQLESKNNKTKIIFKEADGVELVLQGKDRKEQYNNYRVKYNIDEVAKRVRNATFYLAIAYEGKRISIGRDKELVNKIVVGGYELNELNEIFNAEINGYFDKDYIKYEILNTDGEVALNKLANEKTYHQADQYHVLNKINTIIEKSEDRVALKKLYYENKPEEILKYIENLKYDCGGEETEIKKLDLLYSYIKKRKDNLLPYFKKEGMQEFLDELSKETNLEYSNLGCQESVNFQVICQRMKNQRMSWSIKGAHNMILAKTFFLSSSNKDKINNFELEQLKALQPTVEEINEQYILEIEKNIEKTKKKLKEENKIKKENKVYTTGVSNGALADFLKDIGKIKNITDLN